MNYRKSYEIGHLPISIVSTNQALLEAVGGWMQDYETESNGRLVHAMRFTLIGYANNERISYLIPEEARPIHENEYAQYFTFRHLWIVKYRTAGYIVINRSSNKATALVYYKYIMESPAHLEDFMHPIVELLRHNGLYAHHAAAVSNEDGGLLLLGKSGQGKTTLSIDLLSHGFDFLADDRCLIKEDDQGFEALSLYEPARFFSANIGHIPKLSRLEDMPMLPNGKNFVDLKAYYPGRIIRSTPLKGLLFPHWSPNEESRIEPLTTAQAIIDLLPLTMVCFDPSTSKAHFEFSSRMVRSIPSARIVLGGDRENWHKLALEYLKTMKETTVTK